MLRSLSSTLVQAHLFRSPTITPPTILFTASTTSYSRWSELISTKTNCLHSQVHGKWSQTWTFQSMLASTDLVPGTMAFRMHHGQSSSQASQQYEPPGNYGSPNNASSSSYFHQRLNGFDFEEWHRNFQSCHKYFLDHAQHQGEIKALAAFLNIRLPHQKHPNPVMHSTISSPRSAGRENILQPNHPGPASQIHPQNVSLIPYIRRLIVTGYDTPEMLGGFFGENWRKGIGASHEIERRNYLFAAKSQAWLKVKEHYDMSQDETCPYMMPLRNVSEVELQAADFAWSEWLAMGDWMLGPRLPETLNRNNRSPRVKPEPQE